jgi:hypothetical protein
MRVEERKRMVKVLWQKSIGEPRTGGNSEIERYQHGQRKCGRENDLTPDPIGLTAEFKCR